MSAFPTRAVDTIPQATIDGASRPPRYSATRAYWITLLLLCAFVVAWNLGIERHPDTMEGVFVIALVLPAIQLAASVITLIAVMASKRPGRDQRVRHLGKITLRAFLGAVIGIVVMLPLLGKC